jgi:hypothetical protein
VKARFASLSETNIQKASWCYAVYSALNKYRGPKNQEEMSSFLKGSEKGQIRLERIGVDTNDIDAYCVGRDGEPLEFRWSVKSNPVSAPYPICWEAIGVDGVVQVGISNGDVVDCTSDEELAELKKGKYKPKEK